jgi:transcription elongation factor Elf1
MFEDLVKDKKALKEQITAHEQCPACGSTKINSDNGIFIPNGYVETAVCKSCGIKWITTYDTDLNVVNVQSGGKHDYRKPS